MTIDFKDLGLKVVKPTEAEHTELSTTVRQIVLLEKTGTSLALQIGALKRDGVPAIALAGCEMARQAIKRDVNRWKRQVARDYRDLPVVAWARGVHGLGDAITLVLGVAPPLTEFATVSKLWKYSGFAPGQKAMKGQKLNFSPLLKAFMTVRIADPCIKHRASPYRTVYDARRALTAITHPEWTDGHSHNDARRIVAKAVLRDMWLVAHSKEAKIDREAAATAGVLPNPEQPSSFLSPESTNGSEASANFAMQPSAILPALSVSDDVGETVADVALTPTLEMPPTSPSSRRKKKAARIASKPTRAVLPSIDDGHGANGSLHTPLNGAPLPRRRSSPVLETV